MSGLTMGELAFYIEDSDSAKISVISSLSVQGATAIDDLEGQTWCGFCVRTGESIDIAFLKAKLIYCPSGRADPIREGAIDVLQAIPVNEVKVVASPNVLYPTLATRTFQEGHGCIYSALVQFHSQTLCEFPDLQAYVDHSAFYDSLDVLGHLRQKFSTIPSSNTEKSTREAIADLKLTPGWRLPCSVEANGAGTLGMMLLDGMVAEGTWRIRLLLERPTKIDRGTILARRIEYSPRKGEPAKHFEAVLGTIVEAIELD